MFITIRNSIVNVLLTKNIILAITGHDKVNLHTLNNTVPIKITKCLDIFLVICIMRHF